MNRRQALRAMAGVGAATALLKSAQLPAAEIPRKTSVGVVIYCFGLRQRAEKRRDPQADLFEPLTFLEHCRQLGAGGIQLPLGVRDADYAAKLRRQAKQYGMYIEAIANPPRDQAAVERFEAEVLTASRVGACALRATTMPGRRYETFDSPEQFRQAVEQARKSLELAAPVLKRHRVRLAVENHKDQRVAERVELLRHISSEWIGACVDLGNNLALLEDPVEVIEALAPWAFSVHLKDHAVREYADGFLLADVPLGQGCLEVKKMVATLRKAKPDVRFGLELITRDPLKVPCLTEKYWATFGDVPGRDLARTLRLVRRCQASTLPEVGSLPLDEQVAREAFNVTSSLTYAREQLGL